MMSSASLPRYPMHVAGHVHEPCGGEWLESIDPTTGEPWCLVPRGTKQDADLAARAAHDALRRGTWPRLTPTARGEMLHRLANLIERDAGVLAGLDSRDNGKPLTDLRKQYEYLPRHWRYFAGLADKIESEVIPVDRAGVFNFTRLEPVGVVLAITPWNSPLVIASWKIAPALAAGCTVIVKPSEHASASTLHFASLVAEAGVPPGVVNVVTGYGQEIGSPLIEDARIAKVTFTGGEAAGRAVYKLAARHLKPAVLELGGKSPVLVFADADLDRAVPATLGGIFASSGQSCVAGSRLLVQSDVYDEFMRRLVAQAGELKVGLPQRPDTDMGPISTKAQYESVLLHIKDAQAEGARCVLRGKPPVDVTAGGWFVPPTIFADVTARMRLWREEVFGPVLAVMRFDSEEEALAIANDTDFGLAAGVWTRDLARALRMSDALQAGTVWVNSYRGVSSMTPLGGYKKSGFGRENGRDAVHEYLQTKSVWVEYQ